MLGIVRQGDLGTPHGSHPATACTNATDSHVYVNGIRVVLETDIWDRHCGAGGNCHTYKLIPGSGSSQVNVFIAGKEFVRTGDPMVYYLGNPPCSSVADKCSIDVFCG